MKPRVCILKTDGINCEQETSFAFTKAGGECVLVHVNELRSGQRRLLDYHILALSGGFSYGDDVASGKVLAVELLSFLSDQLTQYVAEGNLIIGICNGFQVLVRTGLLPFRNLKNLSVTLTNNDSGRFLCQWIELEVQPGPCVFTASMESQTISLQMAHGEGRFLASDQVLKSLEAQSLVPVRYKVNPNGSLNDIAGVCDPTGRIFGLMPHPERFVELHHAPNWRRNRTEPQGLPIFVNGVNFASKHLV